jgi:hypothetical protein
VPRPALNMCEAAFLNYMAELHPVAGPLRRYHQLLRNAGGNANNWPKVKLVGTKAARDGTGAALKLVSEWFTQCQQAKSRMSHVSAHEPRIHFGLGQRKFGLPRDLFPVNPSSGHSRCHGLYHSDGTHSHHQRSREQLQRCAR